MEIARTKSFSPAPSGYEERSSAVAGTTVDRPVISVIVPVRNSPKELRLCLEHLSASTYASYEVIVVDDASTDESAEVAVELGARLLRLDQRHGPAQARNRGAEIARGEYLLFLDADVCVHPDTMQLVVDTFAQDPGLDAVFGSYDMEPTAKNVLSEYKNLFHHFVHQDSREQATTFWSGCGAIRRTTFVKMAGFSTSYGRPCIEDIELGRRLHKAGHRIMLNKRLQVTHLKRWTLWSIVKTDVLDRGIPWTELMLREGSMPNDLNLKYSQRISVVLAYSLLGILGIGVWHYRNLSFVPLFLLGLISVMDYWSTRRRFTPAVRILMAFAGLGTLAIVGYIFKYWPLLPLALIVGIVAINFRFYAFFLRKRHILLICLVIPLHLLYYLYSGLAFASGITLHLWKSAKRRCAKPADVTEAFGTGTGNRIRLTHHVQFPHSLGLLYSAFTYYCGFKVNSGEYKLMGLAPYGRPIYREAISKHLIDLKPDGSFWLNMDYFNYCQGLTMTNRRFHRLFAAPPRRPEGTLEQLHLDVAASIQAVTEDVMLRIGRHVHEQTRLKNLVLAGGVALNCVANGRLLREGPFEKIWIQPAAGDAGGALGAALFVWHQLLEKPRTPAVPDAQKRKLPGAAIQLRRD